MGKTATLFVLIIVVTVVNVLNAQPTLTSQYQSSLAQKPGIQLDFSVGDATFLAHLIHGDLFRSPFQSVFNRHDSDDFWAMPDSTDDSLLFELKMGDFGHKKKYKNHSFLITEPPHDREIPHLEAIPFMDFNRVNGFYLGLATPTTIDFGPHSEFGIKGGIGYGFAEGKGQSQLAGEYRIPLKTNNEAIPAERWKAVPTLAVGAEYHNMTTTDDAWRTERVENSVYAFLVREDFRDYFKIDGWDAFLAFRPERNTEIRVEYRSDIYYDQPQRVFHGRWGGMKDLPFNTPITTGRFNSWVITAVKEDAQSESIKAKNVFGDDATFERMKGRVYMLQAELGKNAGTDSSFQCYILDARNFNPIIPGISIDTRFRLESGTGNVPLQKLDYMGGPSSLPALKNRLIGGNRLVFLNTELRVSLGLLSAFFDNDHVELLLLNDFGYVTKVPNDNNLLQGFGDMTFSTIAYNIGVGLGHPSGIQFGISWRTDKNETGRFFFRFQRPF